MTVEEKRRQAFEDTRRGAQYLKFAQGYTKELIILAELFNGKEKVDEKRFPKLASLQNKIGEPVDFENVQNLISSILRAVSSAQDHFLNAQTRFISASKQEEKEEKLVDKIKE